jgi:hypothetical protein
MLPGALRNPTRQGILATPDSTYEWRSFGEHVKLFEAVGALEQPPLTLGTRLPVLYSPSDAVSDGALAVMAKGFAVRCCIANSDKRTLGFFFRHASHTLEIKRPCVKVNEQGHIRVPADCGHALTIMGRVQGFT